MKGIIVILPTGSLFVLSISEVRIPIIDALNSQKKFLGLLLSTLYTAILGYFHRNDDQ